MKYGYIAVFVVLAMVIALVMNILKKKINGQLIECVKNDDDQGFETILNKTFTKFILSPFNIDYMRLNFAFIKNDNHKIEELLDTFEHRNLNSKQRQDIYSKAFNYYLSLENKSKAKHWLDLIHEQVNNNQMILEFDTLYDIYLEKGWKYLDEMLENLEDMEETYRGPSEFLISLMYENKGEKNKAKEYRARSEKSMVLLDRKLKADAEQKNKK